LCLCLCENGTNRTAVFIEVGIWAGYVPPPILYKVFGSRPKFNGDGDGGERWACCVFVVVVVVKLSSSLFAAFMAYGFCDRYYRHDFEIKLKYKYDPCFTRSRSYFFPENINKCNAQHRVDMEAEGQKGRFRLSKSHCYCYIYIRRVVR
jgi:hypothetical protein